MCNVTAVVTALMLAFTILTCQAMDQLTGDNWHQDESMAQRHSVQNHMFDGINLTEQQRRQMRDLMYRARHDSPPEDVREMETMHRLVTAENFDEAAVKIQAEKMVRKQIARQVEMARVRNQMYRLLTPEQQIVLNDKHQQRMNRLHELSNLQQNRTLQVIE